MAMNLWRRTAGAWTAYKPGYRSGGAWPTIAKAFYRSGGAWLQFFQNFVATAFSPNTWTTEFVSMGVATATVRLTFNEDGTYTATHPTSGTGFGGGSGPSSGNWGLPTTPGIGASYRIRITPTSGTFSSSTAGVTTGPVAFPVFIQNNSTKAAGIGGASKTTNFTVQIYDAAGTTLLHTALGSQLRSEVAHEA